MNCIEARRMVTRFIKKELTEKETEKFLKHLDGCKDCQDELDIYFTVYKAIDTLDSGAHHKKDYDFKKMLDDEVRLVRYRLFWKKVLHVARRVLMVFCEILLFMCVINGYEMKKGIERHTLYNYALHHIYGEYGDSLNRFYDLHYWDIGETELTDPLKIVPGEKETENERKNRAD